MCSIFKYKNCVGRNFDYEFSYDEEIRIIKPSINKYGTIYNIIGMCTGAVKDYPLLYDGMNEHGLVCGGLAFSGNAVYNDESDEPYFDVESWQFPLRILGNNKCVEDVETFLKVANITKKPFSEEFPPSDLHWFIADKNKSIIVEQTNDGLQYYDGSVMTNNPPYPVQKEEYEKFKDLIGDVDYYSNIYKTRGMETEGLDGSYTSDGRFERLSWLKEHLESSNNSFDEVSQSFHLLSSVEQIYGATPVGNKFEYSIYSIVYDMSNKKVYFKFYDDLCYNEVMI